MKNNQLILAYLLTFFAVSIMLKLFGIIGISNTELFGYALIFYGINLVYTTFGTNHPVILFTGSSIFLTGILFFIINNFEFDSKKEIIFPSILFIIGISSLMLFFNERKRNFLAISFTAIISAFIVTAFLGAFTFQVFFYSIPRIIVKYWLVMLAAVALVIFLNREFKRKL